MKNRIITIIAGAAIALHAPAVNAQVSLGLNDAMRTASQGNRQLQAQRLEVLKSAESRREANSMWKPTVSAFANYSYYFDRQNIFMPGEFTGSPKSVTNVEVGGRNTYNAVITVQQPLVNSSLNGQVRLSAINEEMQHEKLRDIESRLALAIGDHYLAILLQQEQLSVLEQSLERNTRALNDARSFFLQGKGLKSDTLRNYVIVRNTEAAISSLQSEIDILRMELKQLVGMDVNEEIILTDALSTWPLHTGASNHLQHPATENRQDIRMQMLAIRKSTLDAALAKSEFKPQLWATGSYQLQGQSDRLNPGTWPRTSFVGVTVSVPVYSGKRSRIRQSKARIDLVQQQVQLDDLQSRAITEISALQKRLTESKKQYSIHEHSVQAAEVNYKMTLDRFSHGLASRLELTDSELALTQARMQQIQAAYNVNVTDLKLYHASGQLKLLPQ